MKRVAFNPKFYMLAVFCAVVALALLLGLAAKGVNPAINPLVAASVALNVLVSLIWLGASLFGAGPGRVGKLRRTFETKEE